MTAITENEINEALTAGIGERIKLREQAMIELQRKEDKINRQKIELHQEIKKLKDFIEERK